MQFRDTADCKSALRSRITFSSKLFIERNQRGDDEARNRRENHPREEKRVAEFRLQPAAAESRQQKAERHESRADRVVRRRMLAACDVNHVKHVSGEAKAVTE